LATERHELDLSSEGPVAAAILWLRGVAETKLDPDLVSDPDLHGWHVLRHRVRAADFELAIEDVEEDTRVVVERPAALGPGEEIVVFVPPEAMDALRDTDLPALPTRSVRVRVRRDDGEWHVPSFVTARIWIEDLASLIDIAQLET
jgi:hypothetical protein